MVTDDQKAAFLILESSEQGRPVEFAAQLLASYIDSGELSREEGIQFLTDVLKRTGDLLAGTGEGTIWDGLLPGGHFPNGPSLMVVELGNETDAMHAFNSLDQDAAEHMSRWIWQKPNIGNPKDAQGWLDAGTEAGKITAELPSNDALAEAYDRGWNEAKEDVHQRFMSSLRRILGAQ